MRFIYTIFLFFIFIFLLIYSDIFEKSDMVIYDFYNRKSHIKADTNIVLLNIDDYFIKGKGFFDKFFREQDKFDEVVGLDIPINENLVKEIKVGELKKKLVIPLFFFFPQNLNEDSNNIFLAHNELKTEADGIVRAIAPFRVYENKGFFAFSLKLWTIKNHIEDKDILLKKEKIILPKTFIFVDKKGFSHFKFTDGNYKIIPFDSLDEINIKNKYVIIGYSIRPLSGQFFTPITKEGVPHPKFLIHAQFLDAIMNGYTIKIYNRILTFIIYSLFFIPLLMWNRTERYSILLSVLTFSLHPLFFSKFNRYFYIFPIIVFSIILYSFELFYRNRRMFFLILSLGRLRKEIDIDIEGLYRLGLINGYRKDGKITGEEKGIKISLKKITLWTHFGDLKDIIEEREKGKSIQDIEDIIKNVKSQIEETEKIKGIIDKIPFPFLLISPKISFYSNDSFKEFMNKNYNEVKEIVLKFLKSRMISEERNIGGKIYSVNGFYHSSRFYFLMFYDIDEITHIYSIKELYTSWFSHQIRTPLTTLKGFAEILKEEGIKYANEIYSASQRIENLATRFLNFAKLESASFKIICTKVNLNKILEDIKISLSDYLEHYKVSLKTNIEIEEIYSDPVLIKEILFGLIENGIKYNRENGKVFVGASKEGEKYVIKIEDTGTGINVEKEDLFKPFIKSRKRYGLGLPLVKKCVDTLKGNIIISSSNEGTSFTLFIPACHSDTIE